MGTRSWNKDRAAKRIDGKIADLPVKDIEIKEYVRDTDLSNLPRTWLTGWMGPTSTRIS